jgi:hypothetical protein
MSDPTPSVPRPPATPSPGAGCWPVALIIVGALIALVSGLCVGGGLVGTVLDLMEGAAPIQNVLGVTFMYLLVSGPFLAGGIALIVWGVRIQKRK